MSGKAARSRAQGLLEHRSPYRAAQRSGRCNCHNLLGTNGTKVEVLSDVLMAVFHGRAGQFGNTFTNLIGLFGDYLDPS